MRKVSGEARLKTYKLPELNLRHQQSIEEAAKCIFKECAEHLQVNFDRFSADQNEKSLMQIRVGMRRTRVALQIFKDVIPEKSAKRFKREFKYFGKRFGPARDLDELLFGMLEEKCVYPELSKAHEALRVVVKQERAQEYSKLGAELAEGRLTSLLISFDAWLKEDWLENATPDAQKMMKADIGPFAIEVIGRGQQKLFKKAGSLDEKSLSELHKIRKYVKRCRYHLRFFSTLFDERRMQEGFSALVSLQNNLGAINDVSIGLDLMARFSAQIQAEHLPDCLSLIAAESKKANFDIKTHLSDVQKSLNAYQNFALSDADLLS
ncbi:MAG: CHAD domain-containing protein [Sneathiella sp.]